MTQVGTIMQPELVAGKDPECRGGYVGTGVGVRAQTVVDLAHYTSGGAVWFALAVNDTPKIAALMLAAGAVTSLGSLVGGAAVTPAGAPSRRS